MAINPLRLTFYRRTGYTPNDEPASDAVIDLNSHFDSPLLLKEYQPLKLSVLKVKISDADIEQADYLKITDTVTGDRYYYYIINDQRINEDVVAIQIRLDPFATVGLSNISFYGNVTRRSLSNAEKLNYPVLPEPWAPRRPLITRRVIVDLNTNKEAVIPTHISTTFEESGTAIQQTATIDVPSTPLSLITFQDSLSIDTSLAFGYPTAAGDTSFTITTPWGDIEETIPFEQYYTLSGVALSTFLAKAKKYNALDLIDAPYYIPAPGASTNITITEFDKPDIKNKKAYHYYTVLTIRSLAGNTSRSYDVQNTDLQLYQNLAVIVVPDKAGGLYVLPSTIRDTGLNAYTYLDGVYSPFETILYNAVGDTPAKFAADGTNQLNTALNELFQNYINKINAMQYENMRAKYFKDIGSTKAVAMTFFGELLGSTAQSITTQAAGNTISYLNTWVSNYTTYQEGNQYTTGYSSTTTSNSTTGAQTSNSTTVYPSMTTSTTGGTSRTNAYYPGHYENSPNIFSNSNSVTNGNYTNTNSKTNAANVYIPAYYVNSTTSGGVSNTTSSSYTITSNGRTSSVTTSGNSTTTVPGITTSINTTTTQGGYWQNSTQTSSTNTPPTYTNTVTQGNTRSIAEGVNIAERATDLVYDGAQTWSLLKTIIFGGYRNEVHSFMLGNINDYLNRWVSIQNDLHNGAVANLFKNITLVGNFADYNKLAGKYEILITSLNPDDEVNFDLFLEHFGHAVDEYSNSLVTDVNENYNYTLVGEDALLRNDTYPELSAAILNQFHTGVRVWKTLIRPENY